MEESKETWESLPVDNVFVAALDVPDVPPAALFLSSARRLAAATASLLDLGVSLLGLLLLFESGSVSWEGGGGGGDDLEAVELGSSFSAMLLMAPSFPSCTEWKDEEMAQRTDWASSSAALRARALLSFSDVVLLFFASPLICLSLLVVLLLSSASLVTLLGGLNLALLLAIIVD